MGRSERLRSRTGSTPKNEAMYTLLPGEEEEGGTGATISKSHSFHTADAISRRMSMAERGRESMDGTYMPKSQSLNDLANAAVLWEFVHLENTEHYESAIEPPEKVTEVDLFAYANLPDEVPGKASFAKTLINSVKSFVGTGILGLPYAFKEGGLLASIVTLAIVGALACHCILLVVECRRELAHKKVASFGGVGREACGIFGVLVVNSCILLNAIGACTSYLIFIGENLADAIGFFKKEHYVALALICILPLSWLRSLRRLVIFSLIAEFMLLLVLAVLFYFFGRAIFNNIRSDEGFFSDVEVLAKWSSYPTFYGIACFAYEGIPLAIPLEMSMKKKSKYGSVVMISVCLVTCIYIVVGGWGYLSYGDSMVFDTITKEVNNPVKSTIVSVVQVGMSLAMVGTYPMILYPANQIIEELVYGSRRKTNCDRVVCCLLRCIPVGITVVLAIMVPEFGRFMAIAGALICSLLAFVLPSLFHLIIMWGKKNPCILIKDAFILILGLISGTVCFVWVLTHPS